VFLLEIGTLNHVFYEQIYQKTWFLLPNYSFCQTRKFKNITNFLGNFLFMLQYLLSYCALIDHFGLMWTWQTKLSMIHNGLLFHGKLGIIFVKMEPLTIVGKALGGN
jgi:hypothetical protein